MIGDAVTPHPKLQSACYCWNGVSYALLITTIATVYSGYLYFGSSGGYDNTTSSYGDEDGQRMLAAESEGDSEAVNHIPIILMLCGGYLPLVLMYPIVYIRGRGGNFKDYTGMAL